MTLLPVEAFAVATCQVALMEALAPSRLPRVLLGICLPKEPQESHESSVEVWCLQCGNRGACSEPSL